MTDENWKDTAASARFGRGAELHFTGPMETREDLEALRKGVLDFYYDVVIKRGPALDVEPQRHRITEAIR